MPSRRAVSAATAMRSWSRKRRPRAAWSSRARGLAVVLAGQRRDDEALSLIDRALDAQKRFRGPTHWRTADAHLNVGYARRLMGRNDAAVEHFEKAPRSSPQAGRLLAAGFEAALDRVATFLSFMGENDDGQRANRRLGEVLATQAARRR